MLVGSIVYRRLTQCGVYHFGTNYMQAGRWTIKYITWKKYRTILISDKKVSEIKPSEIFKQSSTKTVK